MNNPLYYTPEEAEKRLRKFGTAPSAEGIRAQAQTIPSSLGFPVCVIGKRVYIPKQSFDAFWGLTETDAQSGGGAASAVG